MRHDERPAPHRYEPLGRSCGLLPMKQVIRTSEPLAELADRGGGNAPLLRDLGRAETIGQVDCNPSIAFGQRGEERWSIDVEGGGVRDAGRLADERVQVAPVTGNVVFPV